MGSRDHGMVEFGVRIPVAPMKSPVRKDGLFQCHDGAQRIEALVRAIHSTATIEAGGLGFDHEWRSANPTASSVGPRNTPIKPNASAPPRMPRRMTMNGNPPPP